jgi:voltage-gated potassium channel
MQKWRIFVDTITLVSVVLIVIDYIYPNIQGFEQFFIYAFDLFVVITLVYDFVHRFKKSKIPFSKFVTNHWYEIPSMMPLILFTTIEQEYFLASALRSFRLFRLFRIMHLFFRTLSAFEGNKFVYIFILAFSSILLGAFAEYMVESGAPDSKITTISDAIWWALVTVTTVGYGDVYPVTTEGKIIASFLMIIGIMILGLFISTLGSSFVESWIDKKERKNKDANRKSTEEQTSLSCEDVTFSVTEETKALVKKRIDNLESLKVDEFEVLVSMLEAIYYKKEKVN